MRNGLRGQVVVITGASSGVGRAAARAFAEQGAAVVLAARREQLLHEAADEVIRAGGRAMSVPTDVRDPAQMRRLVDRAVDAFGGIDIWINNAGVASFGKFEDTPPDAFTAVVDTTFHGVVNGFRAVLPHFRDRRRGTVITTASVAGRLPAPFHAAYGAAKHAVLGFAGSVRSELDLDGLNDIHICNLLPGPIDTPFWQHAANFSGREIRALPPAMPPERVAGAILDLALRPRREVGVGAPVWLLHLGMALAQGTIERKMAQQIDRHLFGSRRREPTDGAVRLPMPEGTGASGGWQGRGKVRRSGQGAAAVAGLLAVMVPAGLAAAYRYRRAG